VVGRGYQEAVRTDKSALRARSGVKVVGNTTSTGGACRLSEQAVESMWIEALDLPCLSSIRADGSATETGSIPWAFSARRATSPEAS
jgi:hypothetical protein